MEEVLYSGFLTKSPPEHKINRARWQRRWFVLKRNSRAIYLQYYKDQHSTRPKGTIDLNACEQVDQGLSFESRRSLANSFIFDIVTPKRKYFLVTTTEIDMIRWVREICLACGFQLEDQDEAQAVDPAPATQPINVAESPRNEYTDRPYPASAPALPREVAESYIPLDECVTGENQDLSQSVPVTGGWDDIRNQEEMFIMDQNTSRSRTGSSGSNSSIPMESAPLPPERDPERNSANVDNYDVPPALKRPGSGNMQPLYDVPPALLKREPSFKNQNDIYKPVPVPRLATFTSSSPSAFTHDEQSHLNGDLYDVPPSHALDASGLYDCPPAHPLMRNQNKEMCSSTDKLAQDFQQISVRNSMGASDDGSMDLYSVPPSRVRPASDLFSSPDDGPMKTATPPPRPPKLDPASATNIENQSMATPPRPPKPQHLRTCTPPPAIDETYDVLPSHSRPVPSQDLMGRISEAPHYAVPPSLNSCDIRSPPNGHRWLDNKVPTPGGRDRYINTRQCPSQQPVPVPPNSAGFLHSRVVPPPHPQKSATLDLDSRYTHNPVTQKESYLPMVGSSDSSNVFQYPDTLYMAMEGTNSGGVRPNGRLPSDTQQETYAVMNSAFPVQKPAFAYRHTFSGGPRPPPIDRSLKPDRKTSEGAARSTEQFGMAGSYYAVKNDLPPRPIDDFRPIQSDRTRSFSRRPGQYENRPLNPDLDPFRDRSNTGDSTTSSSDDDMYGIGDSEFMIPRSVPAVPEEDAYIFKDVPGMGVLPERPITEGLSSTPIPASLPSQQNDDIEYLELFHDHNDEVPHQPPPRPPKPSSPTVEYIDLDLDKTQALKSVKEKREEEMDGGVSGRDTLTRRDV